ncbi:hypothetical protein ACET3Z_012618 [Daucus carota]
MCQQDAPVQKKRSRAGPQGHDVQFSSRAPKSPGPDLKRRLINHGRVDMKSKKLVESCVARFKNVVLDLYRVDFTCWSNLFRDTARAYNLLHCIDPTFNFSPDCDMIIEDAVVTAWIFATISPYLLARLLTQKSWTCAKDVWARLQEICQQHETAMQKKQRFIQAHVTKVSRGFETTSDDGVDFISNLPDDVLVYLLSLVNDMKTVGRTSLLSKRWTHVWPNLMDLDFSDPVSTVTLKQCRMFCDMDIFADRVFVDWVNRVIRANRAPYLNSFRICFPLHSSYAVYFQNWINFAFGKEVRNLVLVFGCIAYPKINFFSIFTSDPALILNTTLKTLHLESVMIKGPLLQWVLTNCLNLQRLSVHGCRASPDDVASSKHHQRLVVSSLTVKHVEFVSCLKLLNIEVLHLSAPNLTSIVVNGNDVVVEYHSIPSLVDATFGGSYFPHLDSLSSFSSQLEKLSIEWCKVYPVVTGFPTFVNVQQLEIVVSSWDDGLVKSTSLIEACPLLHTFKLKMKAFDTLTRWLSWYAQKPVMCLHQHLKTVEYVGFAGSASAAELALCLVRHAPMLRRFIFDTRRTGYFGVPRELCTSGNKDQMAIARCSAGLAKRIQLTKAHIDVVIL